MWKESSKSISRKTKVVEGHLLLTFQKHIRNLNRYATSKLYRSGAPKSHEDAIEFINQWMVNHSCEDSSKLTWESLGVSKYARELLKLSEKQNMEYTSVMWTNFVSVKTLIKTIEYMISNSREKITKHEK